MRDLVLIVHNVRSNHNVGSLLRTADGLGVKQVWLTGYTPYPREQQDSRLPHLAQKIDGEIAKTALGAERTVAWKHHSDIVAVLAQLKDRGYSIAALEQAPGSIPLPSLKPTGKLAIIVGREVEGLEPEVLATADIVVEIPMFGRKESFNVSVAAAIALYHCRFRD